MPGYKKRYDLFNTAHFYGQKEILINLVYIYISMAYNSWGLRQKIFVFIITFVIIISLFIYFRDIGLFTRTSDSGITIIGGKNVTDIGNGYGKWKIQMHDWERMLANVELKVIFPKTMETAGYIPNPLPENVVPTSHNGDEKGMLFKWDYLPKGGTISLEIALSGVYLQNDLCPYVEVSADKYGVIYHYSC